MYVDQGYQLADPFKDQLDKYFGTPAHSVDFKTASEESRKVINKWAKELTNSKIQNLLPEGSLNSLTSLVLVNALYFKGYWMTKFDTKLTFKKPFYLGSENIQTNVDMMNINGKYAIGNFNELDARILRLPYKGGKLSMFIILLPNKFDGLPDLEAKLLRISELFDSIDQLLVDHQLDVSLPKFKIEATVPNMKEPLLQMGIKDLFDSSLADLSGINAEQRKRLYVSNVFHNCFIEINEEGTEAAAASGLAFASKALLEEIKPFEVNHPALFFIRNEDSKVILFGGRLVMPPSV